MVNVALWLGVLCVCALLIMAAAVAALSLTKEDTAQLLDQDVLVTVATLQKAAGARVMAMIPGAWQARAASAQQTRI